MSGVVVGGLFGGKAPEPDTTSAEVAAFLREVADLVEHGNATFARRCIVILESETKWTMRRIGFRTRMDAIGLLEISKLAVWTDPLEDHVGFTR